MSSEDSTTEVPAIRCHRLGKAYPRTLQPAALLWRLLRHGRPVGVEAPLGAAASEDVFWALRDVDLEVARGEVVGIVGRNGAGKSTLLQILCGTLSATQGEVVVHGRVAALLELGAGFNPQFTGRENALLNATLLGLQPEEAQARLPDILAFADIGHFVDQPVRTYSSGMFMRLAFAVATSVDPDILVIDEALSVGDGAFARKSFDRVMQLKAQGATILFCSHSMYQVEALCHRALWLDGGQVRQMGPASAVCGAFQAHLNGLHLTGPTESAPASTEAAIADSPTIAAAAAPGTARLTGFSVQVGNAPPGVLARVRSGRDDVVVRFAFVSDPTLPTPALALGISDAQGLTISSSLSTLEGGRVHRDQTGRGWGELVMEALPLLKGRYALTAFLLTEDGLHPYDQVQQAAQLVVEQDGPWQGVVSLPRRWR